jgi:hypothetical protein
VETYHSKQHVWVDSIMLMFQKRPFRCKICQRRFYARADTAVPDAQPEKPKAR